MVMDKPINPPLFNFGQYSDYDNADDCHGTRITLRDLAAIAAMQGLLAGDSELAYDDAAHQAYGHADALLAARESGA